MPSERETGKHWAMHDDTKLNNCATNASFVTIYVFTSVAKYRLDDQGSLPERQICNFISKNYYQKVSDVAINEKLSSRIRKHWSLQQILIPHKHS
jgi:hypothetical protein